MNNSCFIIDTMNRVILLFVILNFSHSLPTKRQITGKVIDIRKDLTELVLTVRVDKSGNRIGTIIIENDSIQIKKIISFVAIGDSVSHDIGSGILFISKHQFNKCITEKFKIPVPSHQIEDELKIN